MQRPTIGRIQRFFQVINPKSSLSSMSARTFPAKPLLFALLLLFVFSAAVIWPSRSTAIRPSEQSSSVKRQRPEFVPGEVLVRFKPGRAFEGRTSVAVARKDL